MKSRIATLGVACLAALTLTTGCLSGSGGPPPASENTGSQEGPVTITFSSYALQEPTIQATQEIVDSWNAANPNIQVEYQKVDPGSVHDKLVTQFAGNAAPDVIHDEAADIAGFSRQGYLADLAPLIPGELKSDVPGLGLEVGHRGRQDRGCAHHRAGVRGVRRHQGPRVGRHRAADRGRAVDLGRPGQQRQEANQRRQRRVRLGSEVTDRGHPERRAGLRRHLLLRRRGQARHQGRRERAADPQPAQGDAGRQVHGGQLDLAVRLGGAARLLRGQVQDGHGR